MVKLVNVKSEVVKDMEFGTCDQCFSTEDQLVMWYVFEDDDGNLYDFEAGRNEHGMYFPEYRVSNIIDFAMYLDTRGIKDFEKVEKSMPRYHRQYIQLIEELQYSNTDSKVVAPKVYNPLLAFIQGGNT